MRLRLLKSVYTALLTKQHTYVSIVNLSTENSTMGRKGNKGSKGSRWRKKDSRDPTRENGNKWEKPKKERSEHVVWTSYKACERENKDFETFYKAQNFVAEGDWDKFMSTLKENLPSAFRITGTKSQAKALKELMKKEFFEPLSQLVPTELTPEEIAAGEEPVKPLKPFCLPWYPDGLAYQLNLTRRNIRRSEAYWRLHQFLISETENGNISRQEAVSMIPPLVLGVEPHHKVLDMCAAPGSKTTQLIEFLHSSDNEMDAAIPSGVVVANDADNRRCYMLVHQAKRLQSPAIMITNHDAAFMPNIFHTRKDGSTGPIKYDRILCDVPCSGDGTMRKNFDVWQKWNALNGANLHGLQLRIARRGLEMLAVGGRMAYSTCSMHPLENEAVLHRLIREAEGAIRLVDISDKLPGLNYTKGLNEWIVMNKELEVIPSAEEIPAKNSNLFSKYVFPPTPEDREKIGLDKCIRILPHVHDTGAFFVALLEKVSPLPGEKVYKEKEREAGEAGSETQRVKLPPKKKQRTGFKEEPFFYFETDESIWPGISQFFDMKPEVDPTHFLSRTNVGLKRNLYFTNKLVKDIVSHNQDHIKIINTGVKVLVRSDNKGAECDFRLAQEGSQVLLPLFNKRKISVTSNDMITMLLNDDMAEPPEIINLNSKTQEQCENLDSGSVAFIHKREDGVEIKLVGWKGAKSIRAYVAKHDRIHYLRLLGGDTTKYEKNKYQEQRDALEKNGNDDKKEKNSNEISAENGTTRNDDIENGNVTDPKEKETKNDENVDNEDNGNGDGDRNGNDHEMDINKQTG